MVPEITILKLLCKYDEWATARDSLEASDLPKELQGIYRTLNSYHEGNNDHNDLSVSDLSNLYFAGLPRDREYAVGLFNELESCDASAETCHTLIKGIATGRLLRKLSLDAYEAAEGRKSLDDFKQTLVGFDLQNDSRVSEETFDFVTDDLNELHEEGILKPGLRWRLDTLNKMLGSLRPGNFGFVFARPETGKTTFLASEVTHMAMQTTDSVLWLNNEQPGDEVKLRMYQAALGIPLAELFRDLEGNKQKYMEMTGGRVLLYDNGHIHKRQVEAMCRKFRPRLIVVDQLDKIQGFDSDREDLRLGTIYQWARELAKEFGCSVIAICQADGSAEGQKWLTMGHVANAKTAKQAEADFILGIGKIDEPGFDLIRYLHASKNKLRGDTDSNPAWRHGRLECIIEPDIARYRDLQ